MGGDANGVNEIVSPLWILPLAVCLLGLFFAKVDCLVAARINKKGGGVNGQLRYASRKEDKMDKDRSHRE